MRGNEEISNIESEAGVIASLVYHPEFCFYSEDLLPNHFYVKENRYIYAAICNLAQRDVKHIDAFSILESLKSRESTAMFADELTIDELNDFIDNSESIARCNLEDYKLCVDNVLNAALRRTTLQSLKECENMCRDQSITNVEQLIYRTLDEVMVDFSRNNDILQYRDVIDDCWAEIEKRQGTGYAGIPFKFPALNDYATIERGELFIFGAEQKQGKSIMLLNCAVDLLKQGYSVLYLDSELNTRMFTARILAHMSGIEYKRLTSGNYTPEERERIYQAKDWLKTSKFTHLYIPTFDQQSIYTAIKKVEHVQGIDVLIVDYFKSSGEGNAFDSYQELGRFVDKQSCPR